jgi:hypothetical protein
LDFSGKNLPEYIYNAEETLRSKRKLELEISVDILKVLEDFKRTVSRKIE